MAKPKESLTIVSAKRVLSEPPHTETNGTGSNLGSFTNPFRGFSTTRRLKKM